MCCRVVCTFIICILRPWTALVFLFCSIIYDKAVPYRHRILIPLHLFPFSLITSRFFLACIFVLLLPAPLSSLLLNGMTPFFSSNPNLLYVDASEITELNTYRSVFSEVVLSLILYLCCVCSCTYGCRWSIAHLFCLCSEFFSLYRLL